MMILDGTKLLVQFYDNWGQLGKVSVKTGVPVKDLSIWLSKDKISSENRWKLESFLTEFYNNNV